MGMGMGRGFRGAVNIVNLPPNAMIAGAVVGGLVLVYLFF